MGMSFKYEKPRLRGLKTGNVEMVCTDGSSAGASTSCTDGSGISVGVCESGVSPVNGSGYLENCIDGGNAGESDCDNGTIVSGDTSHCANGTGEFGG